MKKFMIIIFVMIFLVSNTNALTLKLNPSSLILNGEPNTQLCTKLTIEYSVPDGLVEGRDLWEQEGVSNKILSEHTLSANDLGLEVTYLKSLNIMGSEDVDVCVTAPEGLYHGALLYKTKQSGMIGIELNSWII